MISLLKRLWCVGWNGGHWFELKFIPRPTGRATNVVKIFVCQRCGHEQPSPYSW